MSATLVDNEEPNLTIQDALEYVKVEERHFNLMKDTHNLKIGHQWFIMLTTPDRDKLRGSYIDPFDKDSWDDVLKALRFLLDN